VARGLNHTRRRADSTVHGRESTGEATFGCLRDKTSHVSYGWHALSRGRRLGYKSSFTVVTVPAVTSSISEITLAVSLANAMERE